MSSSTTSQGVVDRVQNFVSENKHAILIATAAAVVAVGGVAYYASTSRAPGGDVEKAEGRKDKKKSKKRKTVKDDDGPILEERKPKPSAPAVEEGESPHRVGAALAPTRYGPTQRTGNTPRRRLPLCQSRCVYLCGYFALCLTSRQERTKVAASLKAKGNTAYQQRKFSIAIEYYSRAIAATPKPEPVFFSNRAACYVNLNPPQNEKVVEDCDAALALDKKYLKALNRRATALEALGRYEEAVRGVFTVYMFRSSDTRLMGYVQTSLLRQSSINSRTWLQRSPSSGYSRSLQRRRRWTFSR